MLIFLHYTVMLIYCIHTRIVCVLFHFQHTTCQYSDHEVRTVVLIWWWSRGLLSVYHSPAFSSQHTTFYSDDQRKCHTQPAVCRSPASSLVCLVGAGPSHHDEKGSDIIGSIAIPLESVLSSYPKRSPNCPLQRMLGWPGCTLILINAAMALLFCLLQVSCRTSWLFSPHLP